MYFVQRRVTTHTRTQKKTEREKYNKQLKRIFSFQRRIHPFFFDLGLGHKCARIASSKTVFKPFCVKAEHSKYLTAPISLRIDSPWSVDIGDSFFS